MSTPTPPRPCPVCDGGRNTLVFRQRFFPLAGAGFLHGYDVVTCADCGCGFADGLPDQAAFDVYYHSLSKYEYAHRAGQESPYDFGRFRAIADMLEPFVPSKEASILDVGCATGGMLSVLRERGYTRLRGLDPSPACAEAARRLHNIAVATADVGHFDPGAERFDLVILIGVLEHVRDLTTFVSRLRGPLRPEGLVFADVPDALKFARCRNAPFQQFSTEHINFFSPASLENLFCRRGFIPVHTAQSLRELSHATWDPAVSVVARRSDAGPQTWRLDPDTEPALREYVAQSAAAEERAQPILDRLAADDRPVLVWGVGTLTLRLLAAGRLNGVNVRAFVDSNPKYHGKTLRGLPVLAPAEVTGRPEPILVATWMYQQEIRDQVRSALQLPNELIFLYPLDET